MLPWLAFSEAVGRAPFVMVEHRNFIKKLVFPVETLPVNLVAAGLVTEFFGMILFALALLVDPRTRAADGGLSAAGDCSADPADDGDRVVSCGAGRVRAGSGTGDRLSAHSD